MEDALALCVPTVLHTIMLVLILVVMEDALAQTLKLLLIMTVLCLNPCCNGRCTRTGATIDVLQEDVKS